MRIPTRTGPDTVLVICFLKDRTRGRTGQRHIWRMSGLSGPPRYAKPDMSGHVRGMSGVSGLTKMHSSGCPKPVKVPKPYKPTGYFPEFIPVSDDGERPFLSRPVQRSRPVHVRCYCCERYECPDHRAHRLALGYHPKDPWPGRLQPGEKIEGAKPDSPDTPGQSGLDVNAETRRIMGVSVRRMQPGESLYLPDVESSCADGLDCQKT